MEKPQDKLSRFELGVSLSLLVVILISTYFFVNKAWRNYQQKEQAGLKLLQDDFDRQLEPAMAIMRKDCLRNNRWKLEDGRIILSTSEKKEKIIYQLLSYEQGKFRLYRLVQDQNDQVCGEALAENLTGFFPNRGEDRMNVTFGRKSDNQEWKGGVEITISFFPGRKTLVQQGKLVTTLSGGSHQAVYPGDVAPPLSSRPLVRI